MTSHPTDQNIEDLKETLIIINEELGDLKVTLSNLEKLDKRIPQSGIYHCPWDNTNGDTTYFR
jgi:hypothetical protein